MTGLRRSLRCTAGSQQQKPRLPKFPDKPEQTLDLANMVPASPLPSHNGFKSEPGSRHMSPAISSYDRLMVSGGGQHGQYATMPQPGARANQQSSQAR